MGPRESKINYIELPMMDAGATKAFYGAVFGWAFTDWGDTYISFSGAGVDGGFERGPDLLPTRPGALVILFTADLEAKRDQVKAAGGKIVRDIFSFPGGRRFHFEDPNGNELAVWSEA